MEFLQKSNRLSLALYNKINATVEKRKKEIDFFVR